MDTETKITAPSRKKRKKTKRAPVRVKSELAGLTATNCPAACNAERCVISGSGICSHPYKGGLRGKDASDAVALKRLNDAKRMLGKAKIDLRFAG